MRIRIRFSERPKVTKRVVRKTRFMRPEDRARIRGRKFRKRAILVLLVLVVSAIAYKRIADPRNAREAYNDGVRLMSATRYDQAALNFSRAIDLKPDFADAYRMRGRVYVAQYSPEPAIRDFNKFIELHPNDATALVERGLARLDKEKQDYSGAIADANRAVSLDPKLARAYNLRGVARRASGDSVRAIDDFTQAIRLQPSLENFLARAGTYQLLNRHDLAIADFTRALVIAPREPDFYFARSLSEAAVGDSAAAKRDSDAGSQFEEPDLTAATNPGRRIADNSSSPEN